MNTNKEKFLGLLREVMTAGGALAFGAFDGMPSVVGLLVAIAAVVWAIAHHEGGQVVATSVRKVLSLVPGVLLSLGWVQPETAASLASFLAPLFAIVWSYLDKGGSVPPSSGRFGVFFTACLALCAFGLVSCAGKYGNATPGFYRKALPTDDGARFGILLESKSIAPGIPVTPDKP